MADPNFYLDLNQQKAQRSAEALTRQLGPMNAGLASESESQAVTPSDPPHRWINCAGNDYLALAQHPALADAAAKAALAHGTGATASRLIAGDLPIHREVEAAFTQLKAGANDAFASLLLPTGYMANLAAITALFGAGDLILLDRLVHASLIDAARLSGAAVRRYPHNDLTALSALLDRKRETYRRCLIVTDSVFSMDGDTADLPGLVDLADQTQSTLLVDEAHGTGVLGPSGAGLAEAQGVDHHRIDLSIATGSKALGGLGGIITAKREIIEHLVNTARPLIYTTGCPPSQAAALLAALLVIRDEPERRERLAAISQAVRDALRQRGWPLPPMNESETQGSTLTPIIPLEVGANDQAMALSEHLRRKGILAPAVRPPTVPPGQARVRLSLRSDLTEAQVTRLIDGIGQR